MNHLPKKPTSCYTALRILTIGILSLFWLGHAWAEDISTPPAEGSQTKSEAKKPEKRPPDLPSDAKPSDDSRNLPKPEVRIIHEKDKTVEEYRVGGRLRYVKITPKHGKPYYLVDRNGDGIPMTYYDPMKGPPPINEWLLLQW